MALTPLLTRLRRRRGESKEALREDAGFKGGANLVAWRMQDLKRKEMKENEKGGKTEFIKCCSDSILSRFLTGQAII
jgi:hypothetical protein